MKMLLLMVMFEALLQATVLGSVGPPYVCEQTITCQATPYRTFDGTCNNLQNPKWGAANTPYARMLDNSYSDGVHAWPQSRSNKSLTNPRSISLLFPDVIAEDPYWNIITLQWGQIVAHDMSFNAQYSDSPSCCVNGIARYDDKCKPIEIPEDDYFNKPEGNKCYDFMRSGTNKDAKCQVPGKAEEPVNTVTSYIDLSIVYGSSDKDAKQLRLGSGGKLKYEIRKGQQWPPRNPNAPSVCTLKYASEACYIAGDKRVNQNPHLTLMQVVLLREHNRIAEQLAALNPHWDDETIYQETRRILIAKAQHITYTELLEIYLGENIVVQKRLDYPGSKRYNDDYDEKVSAQVINEHATAAFRFFHSEIVGNLKIYGENRQTKDSIRLSEWFHRPAIVEDEMPGLARGLCTQKQNKPDRYYDDEIWNYLYRKLDAKLGLDLHAIDFQRARDHGLGSYNKARKACGLSEVKTFNDLKLLMPSGYVDILKEVYESPDDIELAVAGALENHEGYARAGPTFVCIMTEQFLRTRHGDRFFYASKQGGFTLCQLNALRKTSIARLMCDNIPEIKSMQPNAFLKISATNELTPCSQLPQVDLKYWKEETKCKKNCDAKPKDGPSGSDEKPKEGPGGYDAKPKDGPGGSDEKPKDGPGESDEKPKDGPGGSDGKPKDGPSGSDEKPKEGPSGYDAKPTDGLSGSDEKPKEGPSGYDAKPTDGPSGSDETNVN